MNIQGWFPLGWTCWISLQSKGLSRVFSNTTDQSINSLALRFLYSPTLTSIHFWKRWEYQTAWPAPWEGNGNPLQYSCLGNPMDKIDWRATVQGVTKSQTQLSMHACIFRYITGTYFFPVCGLSLHFLNSILKAKIFNFMKLNYGVGEDSWESLGLQGDPTSPT